MKTTTMMKQHTATKNKFQAPLELVARSNSCEMLVDSTDFFRPKHPNFADLRRIEWNIFMSNLHLIVSISSISVVKSNIKLK